MDFNFREILREAVEEGAEMNAELVKCPKCGAFEEHPATFRQEEGVVKGVTVVAVGWECIKCGHKWGFWGDEPR